MTDERPWQAPGGSKSPTPNTLPQAPGQPVGGSPSASQPPPPSIPASPYTPLPPEQLAQPGWAPPPKPGLIPLRPLDVGTILGASFRVLRRNPRPTFGVALLLQSAALIVSLLIVGGVTFASIMRVTSATQNDQAAITAGTVGFTVVSALLTVFLSLIAQALLQGIIVVEVARGALGEKLPLRRIWGFAKGRIWALVGWASILGGVLLAAIGIIVGLIVLLVMTMGTAGIVMGVLLGLIGGLGLLVIGAWLGTKVSLVPSALVLERLPLRNAIARSWTLTNGSFWRVFGIQLLVSAILGLASNIAITPFSIVAPLLLVLLDPNGTGSTIAIVAAVAAYVLQLVVTVVVSAITSIISTATSALIYLDLRMRQEGLDLELTRFVEARQAGSEGDTNPYLRPEPPATGATGYTFA